MPPVQNAGHTICSLEMHQDHVWSPFPHGYKAWILSIHRTKQVFHLSMPCWKTSPLLDREVLRTEISWSPLSQETVSARKTVLTSLHCLKSKRNLRINLRVTCLCSINLTFMITCVRIGVGNIIIKHHLISRWAYGFINSFGFMSHPLTFWQETPEGAENVPCRGQPFED